jgi:CDP-paratose 2-epimerase
MKLLVTGGAGFVGSVLSRLFATGDAACEVVAFDNLKRRGSERNVERLQAAGVTFVHGDVRNAHDFSALQGSFDLVVDASAEPSIHAGTDGAGVRYLFDTNLLGTLNCLEFCRERAGGLVFLSTSRVYCIDALRAIRLHEEETRLVPEREDQPAGLTPAGVSEGFPTTGHGHRSLYGTTKLASELLVEEYARTFDLPAVVNRCGVIAGPGQFGKVEQGVFTLWVAAHLYGRSLAYHGFGGKGKQVRDLLHPADLFSLIRRQSESLAKYRGDVFGVGGGMAGSVSLLEYTALCQEAAGRRIAIEQRVETSPVDVPFFVTDHTKATREFHWSPTRTPRTIVADICEWLAAGGEPLARLFRPASAQRMETRRG